MTTLAGKDLSATFKDLLQVSNANAGIDGTLRDLEDGEGTAGPLKLSTDGLRTNAGKFLQLLGPFGGTATTLTLATGAVTGTRSHHTIAAETGTSDDLDTLTATNYNAGDIVWLTADTGDTIYITTAGNFLHPAYLDANIWLPFIYDGTNWHLLASGLILLDEQTASASATLDFTAGIGSEYGSFLFEVDDIVPATDNVNLLGRTSTDGGSNYDTGASDYRYHRAQPNSGANTYSGSGASTTSFGLATNIGSATGEGVSGHVWLLRPSAATKTKLTWHLAMDNSAATQTDMAVGSGVRAANEDVDAFRFLMSGGNITSGTIRLFGLKY